jgi:hypothetical protein
MLIGSGSLVLVGVLVLQGCVWVSAPVKKLDGVSPEDRGAILGLPLYNEGELAGKEHAVVNSVEGISCKYRMEDPAATEIDAINEAKYSAKDQGAEGIKNLKCDPPRGRTIFHTCWESITCVGQAIKFAK